MGYKLSHRLNCDQGGVRNARLTPDGNFVLTSGANKTVKLWSFKVKASYFAFLVLFHAGGAQQGGPGGPRPPLVLGPGPLKFPGAPLIMGRGPLTGPVD